MATTAVSSLVEAGKIDEAWDIAEQITDYYHRAQAALIIARRTGELQDFENAVILASHIEDEELRFWLEAEIKDAQKK